MPRKTRREKQLDALRAVADTDYLKRPDVRASLEEQGLSLEDEDVDEDEDVEESEESEESETPDSRLDELAESSDELVDADTVRTRQNKLKRDTPDTPQAVRQAALDAAQARIRQLQEVEAQTTGRIRAFRLALADRIGALPTTGGIAFLVFILVSLYLVLLVTNGHTRLEWFWLVLTKRAHLLAEKLALHGLAPEPNAVTQSSGPVLPNEQNPSTREDTTSAVPNAVPSTVSSSNGLYSINTFTGDFSRYFRE